MKFQMIAAAVPVIASISAAHATDVQTVLALITDTADKICNVVTDKGTASSSDAKVDINAQLSGLASKLAAAGVTGTASITNEAYQGPLRTELAGLIKDNSACKTHVFDTLQGKLLSAIMPPPPSTFKVLVCTGEYESNCPGPHNAFYTCGYFGTDDEIAAKVCANGPPKVLRLKTVGGNKCGYALIEVTCNQ
jgi:hypothetical protein